MAWHTFSIRTLLNTNDQVRTVWKCQNLTAELLVFAWHENVYSGAGVSMVAVFPAISADRRCQMSHISDEDTYFTNMLMTLPQCTCPCHFTQLCILTQKQESKTIFYKKSFNNHLQVTYNYNKELKNIVLMWSNKCFSSDSEVHLVEKRWTCNRKFQMESSGAGFPNDLLRINKAGPFMCFFMWYLWPLSGNRGRRQVSLCLFPKLVFFTTAAVWGWEDQSESLGDICAWSGSVSYDELITAPVLIATVRQVPPDDDWNFPTPVEMRQKNKQCIRTAHGHRTHSNRWEQHLVTETRPPTWAHLHLHVKKSTLCKTFFFCHVKRLCNTTEASHWSDMDWSPPTGSHWYTPGFLYLSSSPFFAFYLCLNIGTVVNSVYVLN